MNTEKQRESVKFVRGSGVWFGVALFGCLMAGTAVAATEQGAFIKTVEKSPVTYEVGRDANLRAGGGANVVDVAVIPSDAVAADRNDGGVRNDYIVEASVNPGDYALPGRVYAVAGGDADDEAAGMVGSAEKSDKPMPYALVLALIALIGLVPVSRRYH